MLKTIDRSEYKKKNWDTDQKLYFFPKTPLNLYKIVK